MGVRTLPIWFSLYVFTPEEDKMEEVLIQTEFIKLDSLLKYSALVGSGGEAKQAIQEGIVCVNGEVCTARGKKIFPGDEVSFDGRKIRVLHED